MITPKILQFFFGRRIIKMAECKSRSAERLCVVIRCARPCIGLGASGMATIRLIRKIILSDITPLFASVILDFLIRMFKRTLDHTPGSNRALRSSYDMKTPHGNPEGFLSSSLVIHFRQCLSRPYQSHAKIFMLMAYCSASCMCNHPFLINGDSDINPKILVSLYSVRPA